MLTKWGLDTMPDTKGVITANTETQLKTKTWVRLAEWNRMALTRDMFKKTATALFSADPEHEQTWRMDMVPWSERNPEAFAGMHNEGRRVLMLFDEASAISDVIYEVAEGALTDENTQVIWLLYGNPTRNTGRFRDCFPGGKFEKRWTTYKVDSRTVNLTNKKQIQEWIEDYGEDHDFVRVRVKGEFPRVDAVSFIPYETAVAATKRPLPENNEYDIVLGVDVARYGDDKSVIYPRQGRDARSRAPEVYQGLDTIELATRVRDAVTKYQPSCVFVDEGNTGGSLIDVLRNWRLPVLLLPVQFGAKPDGLTNDLYANKRSEIWGLLRDWLKDGCIPEFIRGIEGNFVDELIAPAMGFNQSGDLIQLESKKDMRRRGITSPDAADALACTFAMPLSQPRRPRSPFNIEQPTIAPDYDPMEAFANGLVS